MLFQQLEKNIDNACKRIAPNWSLENSVAVNPYLGFSENSVEKTADILLKRGNIKLYMPLEFYLDKVSQNQIVYEDLEKALLKKGKQMPVKSFLKEITAFIPQKDNSKAIPTFLDVLAKQKEIDFNDLLVQQTSEWLSHYFNQNRKIETLNSNNFFEEWKKETSIDLLPELRGIENFRKFIQKLPENPRNTLFFGLEKMNIPSEFIETYLHTLSLKLIGWASYCSGLDWQTSLYAEETSFVKAFMAILISWEACLLANNIDLLEQWKREISSYKDIEKEKNNYLRAQAILQDAYDLSFVRGLKEKFTSNNIKLDAKRPFAQMVFCIDVRSEVFRRSIEAEDEKIETFGFAGFFGYPIKYVPINHINGKNQCPVLLPAGPIVYETLTNKTDLKKLKISKKGSKSLYSNWVKFKSGTVSSFSFVSPLGLSFLPKLISDSFGWSRPVKNPKTDEFGMLISGKTTLDLSNIPYEQQLNMAYNSLKNLGLTKIFARLILITGHGSSSVNNPHATGLDCGACGGNSGEVNALTAQLILNNPTIRKGLNEMNIKIPEDTYFLACLHDTTIDEISIINEQAIPPSHKDEYFKIKLKLKAASKKTRITRSKRFGISTKLANQKILQRAHDWAQTRPEWGLAGCHSFIVAPRARTLGINLEGKSFLHSYNWKEDQGFKILESIITAPMVVTSWINLQYYASTVDNHRLGAGNKVLHNVIGGFGVLEGSKGDLKIGLPYQSLHDGNNFQHLPVRLKVIIEAPIEAINLVIKKHQNIKELCDNEWISIISLNEEGQLSHIYAGDLVWETLAPSPKKEISINLEELLRSNN